MAITHDPASSADRDVTLDSDRTDADGLGQESEIELELVEEISIDGMCGVY